MSETTTKESTATTEREAPQALPGFEEITSAWWDAVVDVHEVLLREDADLETVSNAFSTELRARWEYARTLHERGYLVPDYLAERVAVAPLWPLPETPDAAGDIAQAA